MTDTQKMLTIMETRISQSGKTLGVKAHDGTWYQTKDFPLAELTGQAILAMTSQSVWNDKTMHWINDYTLPEGQPALTPRPASGPVQRPRDTSSAIPQPTIPAQPSAVDRDASIVAQALCKTIQHANAQQAWQSYRAIYFNYEIWARTGAPLVDKEVKQPSEQVQSSHGPEFDDDIPF